MIRIFRDKREKKTLNPTPNPAEMDVIIDAPLEMFLLFSHQVT